MLFEFVDHVDESVGNISFGGVVGGIFDLEGTPGVIVRSLVVFEIFLVNWLGSQLVECFHGLVVEQVGISGELVDGSLDLDE